MRWFDAFESPFPGFKTVILIGDKDGLQALKLLRENEHFDHPKDWQRDSEMFSHAKHQLEAYANGVLKKFTLKLNLQGTDFQQQVWQALQTIPYGQTRTYQQIAQQIGRPESYRPVGNANHQNPIPIIVPCHRVTPKNGKAGGYAYGTNLKNLLLTLEQKTLHFSG